MCYKFEYSIDINENGKISVKLFVVTTVHWKIKNGIDQDTNPDTASINFGYLVSSAKSVAPFAI
jgi:hypothetical protein